MDTTWSILSISAPTHMCSLVDIFFTDRFALGLERMIGTISVLHIRHDRRGKGRLGAYLARPIGNYTTVVS